MTAVEAAARNALFILIARGAAVLLAAVAIPAGGFFFKVLWDNQQTLARLDVRTGSLEEKVNHLSDKLDLFFRPNFAQSDGRGDRIRGR